MATIKKYNGSSWENAVVRKFGTATEAVENPLYSDGTAITAYTLKGNEEHTGTPSPSNPVMPQGTGDRTKNLLKNDAVSTEFRGVQYTVNADKSVTLYGTAGSQISYFVLMGDGAATNSLSDYTTPIFKAGDSLIFSTGTSVSLQARYTDGTYYNNIPNNQVITLAKDVGLIYVQVVNSSINTTVYPMITLSTETDTDYEPYGYKIPISSVQTVNNYLGSIQSTRQIKKYVCTGQETLRAYDSQYSRIFIQIPDIVSLGIRLTPIMCTHYQGIYDGRPISDVPNNSISSGSPTQDPNGLYIYETDYTSNTDFATFLTTQYNNGTPVTIWYAVSTPETAAVNEPLMKIGTYYDSISNAVSIPTTEGANSITVDTTVQPSEFTATWTGWHDSSVKEYDGSDWQ